MKPIPGFDDAFATDDGEIIQMGKRRARYRMSSGYFLVNLRIGKCLRKTCLAHRLVCLAYHGPQPVDRPYVRHLDGNPSNNCPANLAWGTHAENMRDRDAHGTTSRGETMGNSKLDAQTVVELRLAVAGGMSTRDAGARFGVSQIQASHIATGRSWRSVGGPITRRKADHRRNRTKTAQSKPLPNGSFDLNH